MYIILYISYNVYILRYPIFGYSLLLRLDHYSYLPQIRHEKILLLHY